MKARHDNALVAPLCFCLKRVQVQLAQLDTCVCQEGTAEGTLERVGHLTRPRAGNCQHELVKPAARARPGSPSQLACEDTPTPAPDSESSQGSTQAVLTVNSATVESTEAKSSQLTCLWLLQLHIWLHDVGQHCTCPA